MLDLNPSLDPRALAQAFAREGRLQIREILTDEAARGLHRVLAEATPWGLAWEAMGRAPAMLRQEEVAKLGDAQRQAMKDTLSASMATGATAFNYSAYPLVTAYLEHWAPGGPLDRVLEDLNSPPLLDFVRQVTGIPQLIKADGQATLYAPGQFLAMHDDNDPALRRRVAYVLNLCAIDWRPDWGGYLMFYDDAGDVVAGYRPRFNALNLFAVPQLHNVSFVPPFAPVARFAITGWFFDRI